MPLDDAALGLDVPDPFDIRDLGEHGAAACDGDIAVDQIDAGLAARGLVVHQAEQTVADKPDQAGALHAVASQVVLPVDAGRGQLGEERVEIDAGVDHVGAIGHEIDPPISFWATAPTTRTLHITRRFTAGRIATFEARISAREFGTMRARRSEFRQCTTMPRGNDSDASFAIAWDSLTLSRARLANASSSIAVPRSGIAMPCGPSSGVNTSGLPAPE